MNKTLKKTALGLALGLGVACCALPFVGGFNAVNGSADTFEGTAPLTEYTLGYGGNLFQDFTTQPVNAPVNSGRYQYETYYPTYYSATSGQSYYAISEMTMEIGDAELAFEYDFPNSSNYLTDSTSVVAYTTPTGQDNTAYFFTYNFGENDFLTSFQYEQWYNSSVYLTYDRDVVITDVELYVNFYMRNNYGKVILNRQTITLPVGNVITLSGYLPTMDELNADGRTFYTSSGGGIIGSLTLHVAGTSQVDNNLSIELRRNRGSVDTSTYRYNYDQAMVAFRDTPDVENNPVTLVLTPVEAFLQTEIFPDFTFGHILLMALGLAVLVIVLKIFLGG